ncbi:MAG TPA: zinc ribbon domain-containing protein, partial [Methylomirabilota bacterium]|nr:zinc ribbon domain-containing protein [Methylomirabilota bacterium]
LATLGWGVLARGLTPPAGGILAFVHGVDLVFHEAGHVIFGFFGDFLAALGGSLVQVLVPALCTALFVRQRQAAATAVTLFWTGESLTDVAVYVADGKARALPLLAEGLVHDWHYLLGRLGRLEQAEALGRLVFAAGVLAVVAALVLLAWDLARCVREASEHPAGRSRPR